MPTDNSNQPKSQTSPSSKSGMPKLLMGFVIIMVILIGIFALTRSTKNNNPSAKSIALTSATVYITRAGFSPSSIQIKKGTTITWTNQDNKVHQVAADPYPKNNSIPGLNSTVVLNKHDSYSFKFSAPGTYTYHDQTNPMSKAYRGTVIVE